MTPGALRVWRAVDAYFVAHGYAPTQREISEALGIKRGGYVAVCLRTLETVGAIERLYGRHGGGMLRGIRLLKRAPGMELKP